jgi:hypothetical protein
VFLQKRDFSVAIIKDLNAMGPRPAQFSKMNRLAVGYLAGWAAPNGGPLDGLDGFGSGSGGDSVHIHAHGLRRFLLGSGHLLGSDISLWFGPNWKNLRLDARPCSAARRAAHGGFTTRLHWKG